MNEAVMQVDEVAAHTLLVALGLEPTPDAMAVAAAQLQAHRTAAERFQQDRARNALFTHLEQAFMRYPAHDEHWSAGYAAAEHEAMVWFDSRSLASEPRPAPSVGSILRSMMRARRTDAPDHRHHP